MRIQLNVLGAVLFAGAEVLGAGYADMCFKPPAGQADYPWTWGAYWFADPGSQMSVNRVPTAEDSVLLWSSKNVAVPLRVGAGVHAETRDLRFGNSGYGAWNPQAFLVEAGGSMTNFGNVIVGGSKADSNTSGHPVVAGDWCTMGNFTLGQSKLASTLTVSEGGHFANNWTWPENANDDNCSTFLVGAAGSGANNVVTNRGDMELMDLHLGSGHLAARGTFENFGTLRIARKLTIGRQGYGCVHLHKGGRIEKDYFHGKPILVGFGDNAEGVLELDDDLVLKASDYVNVGSKTGSKGTVRLNDATLAVSNTVQLGCGRLSRAELELRGNSRLQLDRKGILRIGCTTGALARVTLRGSSVLDGPAVLYIPESEGATGVVEVLDHAVVTNIASQKIALAEPRETQGELVVAGNAYVGGLTNLSVCVIREVPSAQVTLRGGTIGIKGGGSGVWSLFLGSWGQTQVRARIRGWGRIVREGPTYNMLRMAHFGQVIADGEGAMQDLDFGHVRTVGRNNSENNNVCGSNGWYAVSGGRLVFPRIQEVNGNSHRVLGDYPNRATPLLVNSLRVTMTEYPSTANYHIYGALYAPDRTDIPAGLPCGKKDAVKGVWRLAFSSGDGIPAEPTPVDFRGLKVQIRHDARDIPEDAKMAVWHHDGTADGVWTRVAKSKSFDPANPYVASETAVDPSSETWNAGWFAVVAHVPVPGMSILVR